MKKIVFAFGRMNPPTTGHLKLVNHVKQLAAQEKADHLIVASHTQDAKKNPLTKEQKEKHIGRFFPNTNVKFSSKDSPSFISQLKGLHSNGYSHVTMVAGSDRVPEFQRIADKYNGKEFSFKHIKVVSAGKRDPDSESVAGMSASKMRGHAVQSNYSEFKKGIPKHVSDDHAKELYNDIRSGMNVTNSTKLKKTFKTFVKEQTELPQFILEGPHDQAIHKAVFMAGTPGSGKSYVASKVAPNALGFRHINSDVAFVHGLQKAAMRPTADNISSPQGQAIRARAGTLTRAQKEHAIHGRLGLVIDGTGRKPDEIAQHKQHLEKLGYQTKMVYVNTSLETALKRNKERPRNLPDDMIKQVHAQTQDAMEKHKQLFGKDFHMINNEDGRPAQMQKDINDTFKHIAAWSKRPSTHPEARRWLFQQKNKASLFNK